MVSLHRIMGLLELYIEAVSLFCTFYMLKGA
jgi:hypothetical protein